GGWLVKNYGAGAVFAACAACTCIWLVVAWHTPTQPDPVVPATATT
ncbi:MAG: MFS transporter, partial [Betaproteobacteria bacterium]|nr:MFS transporter [Betaproteobacteria bacterium]